MSKEDRILRLVPVFQNGKFYLPKNLYYQNSDLVKIFIEEEYLLFPFVIHDDILDCLARIMDDITIMAPTSAVAGGPQPRRESWDPWAILRN